MNLTQLVKLLNKLLFKKKMIKPIHGMCCAALLSPIIIYLINPGIDSTEAQNFSSPFGAAMALMMTSIWFFLTSGVIWFIHQVAKQAGADISEKIALLNPINNKVCKHMITLCKDYSAIREYQRRINKTDRNRPTQGEYLMFKNFLYEQRQKAERQAKERIDKAREAQESQESELLCAQLGKF